MRIEVDGNEVVNNFPSEDVLALDLKSLSEEEKKAAIEDPSLFTFTMDEYTLPKLLIKAIKSLRKNEVSELRVVRVQEHLEKLRSNFTCKYFD